MQFSPSQKKAINSLDKNVLVSASAGSGKTTVMIARVVNMIKSGVASLDNMLICTFTKKSALDMKEKLYKALSEEKEKGNGALFEKELNLLPTADISTIDSWCQKIVKTYFYEIDVDPAFDILEETEGAVLLNKCIERAIFDELETGDADFMTLYDSLYSKRSDGKLRSIIRSVYDFATTQSESDEWLEKACDLYDCGYEKYREEFFRSAERGLFAELEQLMLCSENDKFYSSMQKLYDSLESRQPLQGRMAYGKDPDPILKKSAEDVKDKIKAFVDKYKATGIERIDDRYARVIARITKNAKDKFRKEKDKKAKLDFSDLEHYAYEILKCKGALAAVREKYKYIYVDEYQDINPLQESILKKLKGDGNMFFVGDLKQSIYAFRNCDPKIFADLYANAKDYGFVEPIDFVTNYRCSQDIVEFVNDVFEPVMTEDFGSVNYKKCRLEGKENNPKGEVKVKLYKPAKEKADVEEDYAFGSAFEEASDRKRFAEEIVADIMEKIGQLRSVNGEVDYSSIAVLSQKRSGIAATVYELLLEQGVPVHMSSEAYYSSHPSIRLLVEFLRLLDNGEDEIAFASLCLSELFNVTRNELALTAREGSKSEGFVSKAKRYAQVHDDELSVKYTRVFELYQKYSEFADYLRVGELLGKFIAETDYFNRTLAYRSNVNDAALLSDFLDFVNGSIYGDTIYEFLSSLDKEGDKYGVGANENSVNILTVHSSKGLEFPYVYVVGCNEKKPNNHEHNICVCHKHLGIAFKAVNSEEKRFDDTPLYVLGKLMKDKEEQEEHMRLLYVALTRAQNGLYVYATVKDTGNSIYKGMKSSAHTFYGLMSEAILKKGFEIVDGDDEYSFNAQKRSDRVYSKPNEELLTVLKNSLAFDEKTQPVPLKTSVTQRACEGLELENLYAFESEERDAVEVTDVNGEVVEFVSGSKGRANVSATERGNVFHKIMEMSDFTVGFEQSFENAKLSVSGFEFTENDVNQLKCAYAKMSEIAKTHETYREKSFVYNDNGLLVQGVIDLLAIDKNGNAIVIDYKTTSKKHLQDEKVLLSYRRQVGLYSKAVSEILRLPVSKVLLYSFELNDFIPL